MTIYHYATTLAIFALVYLAEQIKSYKRCSRQETDQGLQVDCSHQSRIGFPSRNALPNTTARLDLSFNNITHVPPIKNLPNLVYLDLSHNPICDMSAQAFAHLPRLRTLCMRSLNENYRRDLQKFLPKNIFLTLEKVQTFKLSFEISRLTRSPIQLNNSAFLDLKSLRILSISCFYLPFPAGFQNLRKLRILTIVGPCSKYIIPPLVNLPSVQRLTITKLVSVFAISPDMFSPLTSLEELRFEGPLSNKDPTFLGDLISAIRNIDIKSVHLDALLPDCLKEKLKFSVLKLLANSTLTSLSLNSNCLKYLDLELLPRRLRALTVEGNCLSFKDIMDLGGEHGQLERIKALNQIDCKKKLSASKGAELFSSLKGRRPKNYALKTVKFSWRSGEEQSAAEPEITYKFMNLTFLERTNAPLKKFGKYYFYNLPNIQDLSLARCSLETIVNLSFSRKLKFIDLSSNHLGNRLMRARDVNWFKKAKYLKTINLSDNELRTFPANLLINNKRVLKLNFSNNKIQTFDNLTLPSTIRSLDLSFNLIQTLHSSILKALDEAAINSNVTLNLAGNPLVCNCHNLEFVEWLSETKVNIYIQNDQSDCLLSNNTKRPLDNMSTWLPNLKSECKSFQYWIIGASVAFIIVLLGIIWAVLYRQRWKIRYMYYAVKLSLPKSNTHGQYERMFDYDAFISYAENEHSFIRQDMIPNLEEAFNLRLCIHERDFLAGESVALNISRALHNSKRTVLVLSKKFLQSHWCMYELNMARLEGLYTQRSVILLVMFEEIPTGTLPLDVLDLIRSTTYVEYPTEESDRELFWRKCADFIRK